MSAGVIADSDMTLVQLHSHVVTVAIVKQDAIAFSCGDLAGGEGRAQIPGATPLMPSLNAPTPPTAHLQRDVGPRPVLQVGELQVRVTVHKVDTQQLLTLGATKARQALAEGTGAPLHTWGPILALSSLTETRLAGGTGWHLAELATAGSRVLQSTGVGRHPTCCPVLHGALIALSFGVPRETLQPVVSEECLDAESCPGVSPQGCWLPSAFTHEDIHH